MNRVIRWTLSTVTALFVAVTLIGAGLAVCALPDATTRMVSERTSNYGPSPFNQGQLTAMAVATKQYTVNVHDRGALDAAESELNGGRDTSKLTERYVLGDEAIEHLDDVHEVLLRVGLVLACMAFVAVLLSVLCALWKGMLLLGDMLIEAGIITMVFMGACALMAALGFEGFFNGLHALFFAEGTWTFPADSLLISMYPANFWMTMGVIWAAATCLFAAIVIAVGIILHGLGKKKQRIPYPFAQQDYDILYY